MDCRDCLFCIDDDMVLYCRENGFRLVDDGTEEANGNREPCEDFKEKKGRVNAVKRTADTGMSAIKHFREEYHG